MYALMYKIYLMYKCINVYIYNTMYKIQCIQCIKYIFKAMYTNTKYGKMKMKACQSFS